MIFDVNDMKLVQNNTINQFLLYVFFRGDDEFFNTYGHYTQVVWADSAEVGCGIAYYKDYVRKFF